jgi:hypothetical protein
MLKRYGIITFLFIISLSLGLVQAQTYVGPERCLECHNNVGLGDMTGWRSSMHANGYSHVPDDAHSLENLYGIVADGNQNMVDDFKDSLNFNDIESAFDQFKPNAPILGYSAETGYTIKIGEVTHKVYLTYGGSGLYKQRYMVKINTSEGESAALYISPVQYNDKTYEYVTYHPEAWWDESDQPIYTTSSTLSDAAGSSRSMPKGCSGCHLTGAELSQDVNGEWIASGAPVLDESSYDTYNNIFDLDGDGDLDQINTGCEECHGPGGDHQAAASKDNIINPATDLTAEESNNLCGMCHNRGKSLPNNTFGFPFDDENLISPQVGDIAADFFTDGGADWGDGETSKSHRQQFLGFSESSKPTFEFHQVTCFECHDVHNTEKHHMRTEIVEEDSLGAELVIATENDNNTLCLACHATHGDFEAIPTEWVADYTNHVEDIGTVVSAHTNHSYDPENTGASRCSKCHNPKTAKSAVAYDIHSHTFEPIPPQKTILNEMPNACAVSCHMGEAYPNFGIDFSGDNLTDWTEATDIALADTLMYYYGPGGIWWNFDVTSIAGDFVTLPEDYRMSQNYPNPFNPTTKIDFTLPNSGDITIEIYNIMGQKVAVLVDEYKKAGKYTVEFNAAGLASGMYFYRMISRDFMVTNKMIVMK